MSPFNFILVNSCSKSPKKVPNLLKVLNLGPYEKIGPESSKFSAISGFQIHYDIAYPHVEQMVCWVRVWMYLLRVPSVTWLYLSQEQYTSDLPQQPFRT